MNDPRNPMKFVEHQLHPVILRYKLAVLYAYYYMFGTGQGCAPGFQKLHLYQGGMPCRKMFDQAAVTRCIQCIASQMDTLKARFLPIK